MNPEQRKAELETQNRWLRSALETAIERAEAAERVQDSLLETIRERDGTIEALRAKGGLAMKASIWARENESAFEALREVSLDYPETAIWFDEILALTTPAPAETEAES